MSSQLAALLEAALTEVSERVAQRVLELQREQVSAAEGVNGRSPWMGVATTAAYLDWPKQRLYKLAARGEIPHFKQEGRLLFHRGELERWLAAFAEGPGR